MIHAIIAWLHGECPKCHSLKVKDVKGWPKMECKVCHHTWRVA